MKLNQIFKRTKKQEQVFQEHFQFINDTIKYLQENGFSVKDSQIVAQIAELASRGEVFAPLLVAAEKAVATLQGEKLHPIDALFASQIMALIMKNDDPTRIVTAAKDIAEKFAATGLQQNLFSTDMANMGRKLTEVFSNMGLNEIKIEEV